VRGSFIIAAHAGISALVTIAGPFDFECRRTDPGQHIKVRNRRERLLSGTHV